MSDKEAPAAQFIHMSYILLLYLNLISDLIYPGNIIFN